MMSSTYSSIRDKAEKVYLSSFVKAMHKYDTAGCHLPPPLNLIVKIIRTIFLTYTVVRKRVKKLRYRDIAPLSPVDSKMKRTKYCRHCASSPVTFSVEEMLTPAVEMAAAASAPKQASAAGGPGEFLESKEKEDVPLLDLTQPPPQLERMESGTALAADTKPWKRCQNARVCARCYRLFHRSSRQEVLISFCIILPFLPFLWLALFAIDSISSLADLVTMRKQERVNLVAAEAQRQLYRKIRTILEEKRKNQDVDHKLEENTKKLDTLLQKYKEQ